MSRKGVSLLVLICMLVVGLGLEAGATKAVTIDFLNFSSSGANTVHLEKMKEAFEAKHPDIKVNIETIGFGDYFVRLMTAVAGGTAPDAYELNYENFAAYAKKGALLNLQPLIEQSGFDASVINANALEAFQSGGVQYGLPFSFSNVLLIYNKELFDKAGVAYPTEDWTWDDELEAAKKIRALGPNIFGIYQPVQFWEFYKVVRQNGGSLLNEDKTKFTVNLPQNVEALQWLVDKVLKYNVTPTQVQLSGMGDWDLFKAGRLGMLVTGSWVFPDLIRDCTFEWDIAVEPGNTSKATHFFANGLVINKDSDKAEEAFKWISFLSSSKEAAMIRIEAGWELPAVTAPEVIQAYMSMTPPNNRKAVFDSLDYLVTPPVIEQFGEMTDIMGRYLAEALDGVKTPKEALDAAQKELEEKIKL